MTSASEPVVQSVTTPTHWKDFFDLRRTVYRTDPAAVIQLRWMEKLQLDKDKHPFYRHADYQAFICYRGDKTVGRIAAIKDDLHNEYYGDRVGFFGFFECFDDQQVADCLIGAAAQWLKGIGCTSIRGPVNPSMKSDFGVLVEGHESVPQVMMGHTPLYYDKLLRKAGFEIAKRFFAFKFNQLTNYFDVSEKWAKVDATVERISARFPQLSFRSVDAANYEETLRDINELGNQVRSSNYGFVPLTEPELEFMISQLKRIIRLDMIHAAYWDDKIVGFIVNIPDINWALTKTRGRYDWIRMPQLLYWINKTKRTRVIALGVHEEFRRKGIAIALIKRLQDVHHEYEEWEFSWVVEDNLKSIRAIGRTMPLIRHKTYHLYEKPI